MNPYSSKLKEAMAEIKAILTKHDIAGHVLLQEPGFSEYLMAIEPSWSVLRVVNNGIRIRSKLQDDFDGDRAAKLAADQASANLVRHFADLLARDAEIFEQIDELLHKTWASEHGPGTHTPHRPQ